MQHSIVSGYSIVGQLNEVFFGKKYVFVSSWSVKYGNVAGGARSSLVGRRNTANWFVLLGFVATVLCAAAAMHCAALETLSVPLVSTAPKTKYKCVYTCIL